MLGSEVGRKRAGEQALTKVKERPAKVHHPPTPKYSLLKGYYTPLEMLFYDPCMLS
jgi:hypothetical protein